jgi:SAM-dependent methyltransferase
VADSQTGRWRGFELGFDAQTDPPLAPDVVIGPSPTTDLLARLTPWRRVERALDLATGCGALALLAARHAEHVVATDVNERALDLVRSNAERNGIDHVEVRAGNLFDALSGERFDLIVGNLPFVLSPTSEWLFRDGTDDRRDDGSSIVTRALSEVGDRLTDDGVAVFLANWPVADGEPPMTNAVRWLRASGCGGLVLHVSTDDSQQYARRWNSTVLTGPTDAAEAAARHDMWVKHLRAMGATAVANGAIVVHRSGRRTVHTASTRVPAAGEGGRQVDRIIRAPRLTDDELAATRVRLVTPHTATLTSRDDGVRRLDGPVTITLDDTCGVVGRVPAAHWVTIRELDASAPMGDLDVTPAVAATVRSLIALGIAEAV